jgi:hypothetical protein
VKRPPIRRSLRERDRYCLFSPAAPEPWRGTPNNAHFTIALIRLASSPPTQTMWHHLAMHFRGFRRPPRRDL